MDAPTIYHAAPVTWELCGTGVPDPDPRVPDNWLIPARAYLDAPPEPVAGFAIVRNADQTAWELVEDNRGPVYVKATGEALTYPALGPLPDELTLTPCPGRYYTWTGEDWLLDTAAQREGRRQEVLTARDERLAVASVRIAPLLDAVELGRATEAEQALLLAWKHYRVDLGRIEQQEGFPMAVEWPPSPEDAPVDD
ncbi:tail fiber assembly protein [Pseudomonas inefficax]|uniref:tail fiber assembly protein n=1 Tax=Pseudomonas inefficax TaxID=2078786 RepID=UPI00207BC6B0|nr:tail fiber assembly protein [Pseudomonas inefficax]MCM8910907.1 tail fiber assembly protein [Pseudomonas inefficax]